MNYCLDDGTSLDPNAEKTISFGANAARTNRYGGENTAGQSGLPTHVDAARKKTSFGLIVSGILVGVFVLVGLVGYSVISSLRNFGSASKTTNSAPSGSPRLSPSPAAKIDPVIKAEQVKLELIGKVKSGFDRTYLKCRLTNASDKVLERPRINLTLYKNDVKIGTTGEDSQLKYLKPGQSVPIWISLSEKEESYTAARPDQDADYKAYGGDAERLFPNLIYSDAKLTSEEGSILINFRSFKETYYEVKGTVENRDYDLVNADLFVLFYDADSEIVGITSTSPPELKRGEKAVFEASISRRSLFGVPVRFELIAVDDSRKN